MSSKEFLCTKCNKTFSSLGNLNLHIKTICSNDISLVQCEYCNKKFKLKPSLTRHYLSCKIKIERDSLNQQSNTSEVMLLKTELKNSKQQIFQLETENKRLSDLLSSLTEKMPTIDQSTNNTTNNTVNINMNLFDHLNPITDETFFQYAQELTQTILLQGLDSILNVGMKHFKDKIVCTDTSRNTLNYKINDQNIKDKGGVRLAEQLLEQSIEPKIRMHDRIITDVYAKKSKDPTILKDEQSRLDSIMELRNAIVSNDETLKVKIGSKLSKRAITNHAMIADINGAVTQNMWEFFSQVDKSKERVLFNGAEYFLVRDAKRNVIRALEVDEDGSPIMDTEIDFTEQNKKMLPLPPVKKRSEIVQQTESLETEKKRRGRPKKNKNTSCDDI